MFGYSIELWLDTFKHCCRLTQVGYERASWPDGESFLDQENAVVTMFDVMKGQVDQLIKARNDSGK